MTGTDTMAMRVRVRVLDDSKLAIRGMIRGRDVWLPRRYVGYNDYIIGQTYTMHVPLWLLKKRGVSSEVYADQLTLRHKEEDMANEPRIIGHVLFNTISGILVCGDFFEGVDEFVIHVVYIDALTNKQYRKESGWGVYSTFEEAMKTGTMLKLKNKNTGEYITGYFIRQTTRYIHIRSQASYAHEYGWEPVVSKEVRAEQARARCSPDIDELIDELQQKEQLIEKIRKVIRENEEDV